MIDRATIARMLGVTLATFYKRVEAAPDFPKPVLRLSRKTVRWDEAQVKEWIERRARQA